MADDHEERSFEVVKLRIAFLQHITTLSGAAILIVLALIQRAETPKGAYELAIAVPWFVVSTLISMAVILMLIPDTEFVHHLRASTGSNSTDLAGAAFTTGVAAVAAHAFDVPTRFSSQLVVLLWWLPWLLSSCDGSTRPVNETHHKRPTAPRRVRIGVRAGTKRMQGAAYPSSRVASACPYRARAGR